MVRLARCAIVSVCMVAACGVADQSGTELIERTDSAGVEVIRVLRPPAEDIRFAEPLFRIGSEDMDGSGHPAFQLISDVVVMPSGRVVVVDNGGARVSVFDDAGQWLFDLGGAAKGRESLPALYGELKLTGEQCRRGAAGENSYHLLIGI